MTHTKEQLKKYRHAFNCQKTNAKLRGIEWMLTFDEWLNWWGDDVTKRGSHRDGLQMQRFGDAGPYALDNIKKGRPKDNAATWAKVLANKKAEKAKRDHELFLDALMLASSKPDKDTWIDDEHFLPPSMNGAMTLPTFNIDK